MWDTHAHVVSEYYTDINSVIKNAGDNNIKYIINSGCDKASNNEIMKQIDDFVEIYGTLGIHPNEVLEYDDSDIEFIKSNLYHSKILAIGEIGLDYHYGKDNVDKQKELFETQLKIAEDNKLPVVVHSREATKDTIDILKKYKVTGVIHSFSGSYETACEYIKMGFLLGINGVITFKNSNLKDSIKDISLNNIVLETDCPYLTPVPFRGKKNEPANIKYIGEYLSKLYDLPLCDIEKVTNENVLRVFDKI